MISTSNDMNIDTNVSNSNEINLLASSIEKVNVSNVSDPVDATCGPWIKVARRPRRRYSLQQDKLENVNNEKLDLNKNVIVGLDSSFNIGQTYVSSQLNLSNKAGGNINSDSNLVSIPMICDVGISIANVSKDGVFNSLVEKVTPSLIKFNSTLQPKPPDKRSKVKGKGVSIFSEHDSFAKFEVNNSFSVLDNFLNTKKNRSRKDSDSFALEFNSTTTSSKHVVDKNQFVMDVSEDTHNIDPELAFF
ncbi:hypothetical protein Cni_G10306 [Canna indica]|uniref:Uncharacterized protein n=1 Tax=Canna indica TaxID=4628 RepID=A0AAQ3Q8G4_9LILI|nr:hypothetical protein Cni_G10306 [Canna indica]